MILPLELTDICVTRKGKRILGPVSHKVAPQGVSVVIGPNGAGKTTLLRAMHGMERLSGGHIRWAIPEPQTRAKQAFVFQRPTMLRRSVLDNIAYPLVVSGMPRAEARARAAERAREVGLEDRLHMPAQYLSGGEGQKMALMRALIRDPEILFLDEPCANLDGPATRDIEAILTRARGAGTAIVMSTHSMGQARRLADHMVFLHHGQIIEHGPTEPFFTAPQTPEARAHIQGDLIP